MNTVSFPNLNLTFNINRVAFSVFGVEIYWYALIITFGIILAYIFLALEAKREKLNPEIFSDVLLIGLPCAIVGARLYYVIYKWDYYGENLLEIFNVRNGGLAVYGGVIAGGLAAYIYLKKKKLPVLKIFDICSIGLLIGQCVGRWGNFMNVEAYGCETQSFFKMEILSDVTHKLICVHPTFLYESCWCFLGIIVLYLLLRHKKFDGQIFFSYFIWYGFGRFFIESLRSDSLYLGSIKVSQLVSVIGVIIGVVMNIILYKRNKNLEKL